MEQVTALTLALIVAAVVGIGAVVVIARRRRGESTPEPDAPYAASTEGSTRCPKCGMGNLWTDDHCVSCGAKLRG